MAAQVVSVKNRGQHSPVNDQLDLSALWTVSSLIYQPRVDRCRRGEPEGFTCQDYRDLIIVMHWQLAADGVVLG